MKILLSFFLFTLCTAVLSQDPTTVNTPTYDTSTVTVQPMTSQDTTVTSITTTDVSSTTAAQDTTVAPITTSDASSTTATPITTTVSTTSSTTKVPVTTPAATTTTKAPEPEKCSWNVTQRGVTCIRAELKAEFIIPIEGKEHSIILGCNASSLLSDCSSNETQILMLLEATYNLTMVFEKESNTVFVRNVTFTYNLPEGQGVVANNSETMFKVKAGNSYLCKSELDVHLDNVTMKISEIHIQAFEEKDAENFGSAEECEADDKVSDIVPIAVGVALGALIIIVLIAYLVGRRRSRQKGYQSV